MCDSKIQIGWAGPIVHCDLAHSREDVALTVSEEPTEYVHESSLQVDHGYPPHHKQYLVMRWTEELPI